MKGNLGITQVDFVAGVIISSKWWLLRESIITRDLLG